MIALSRLFVELKVNVVKRGNRNDKHTNITIHMVAPILHMRMRILGAYDGRMMFDWTHTHTNACNLYLDNTLCMT